MQGIIQYELLAVTAFFENIIITSGDPGALPEISFFIEKKFFSFLNRYTIVDFMRFMSFCSLNNGTLDGSLLEAGPSRSNGRSIALV